MDIDWTEEKVAQMLKLLDEGKRSPQIARELGTTKNAIIGKIHRLGHTVGALNHTQQPEKPLRVRRRLNMYHLEEVIKRPVLRIKPVRAEPVVIKMRVRKQPTKHCTLLELDSTRCHWPLWGDENDDPRLYCGAEAVNRIYCQEHRERAKQKFRDAYVKNDPSRVFVIRRRPAKSPKSIVA